MITAIVHISIEPDQIPEAAQIIADMPKVTEVYSVAGDVDLIAVVRVREHEELADAIADAISKVQGVRETMTYIAFRAYSKHDLDSAFDLGLD